MPCTCSATNSRVRWRRHLAKTRILPIEVPKSAGSVDYIYEQKPEELLGSLLPRYVSPAGVSRIFGIGRGRTCGSHDGNDGGNIERIRRDRQVDLEMNRVRQAAITREIIEIVSAAAL